MLDIYVIAAIWIIRVLKKVPKNSPVSLAEDPSKKFNDIFDNVEDVAMRLIFYRLSCFFFGAQEWKWTQTNTSMSSLITEKNSRKCRFSYKIPSSNFKPASE